MLSIVHIRLVCSNSITSETGGSDDEFDNGSERSCSCTIM
ncbi:hypothetical protein F383_02754 [Gossypium arboreum]|uniref:Uncharacterized protein n=1 Tax=Gossypium arboreum TaxID=29729 RepID=A0A0B0NPZ2_GOSAR|nr:hypothetical protein F383_02754 [Gossypium arboreum]